MAGPAVSALALPRFLEAALIQAGYTHLDDLDAVAPDELATAQDVLRQVEYRKTGPSSLRSRAGAVPSQSGAAAAPASQGQTAASLLRGDLAASTGAVPAAALDPIPKEGTAVDLVRFVYGAHHRQAWTTGSRYIDHLLSPPPFTPLPTTFSTDTDTDTYAPATPASGGVRPGMVLGLAAPPGTGKTSLIIRVAVSARIPVNTKTTPTQQPSEVLLVDAEGSLTGPKLLHAATAVINRNTPTTNTKDNASSSPPLSNVTAKQLLDGIHVVRVTTQPEMLAFWYTLDDWLRAHPSVIIANQMATKLLTNENKPAATFETGEKAILMPQLGDLWVPPKALKLSLFKAGKGYGVRYAHVQAQVGEKGERPWAPFDIDDDGVIRDLPAATETEPSIE
ncbi:hypothetical protein QFC19_003905 [Naganishia cerealis]|uniref:Uncharacterized protein n=1 Tax=Naganishia cerealis TaxID=610337 RepID=A0ACC2W0C6_9TREE|nr:hypothetical protein QFC19_003905 [Naganishia cerealis]